MIEVLDDKALLDLYGGRRPLTSLLLILTDLCNLNCRHCFMSAKRAGRVPDADAGSHMSSALAARVIDDAVDLGLSAVSLTGGEPLLAPVAAEIMRHVDALSIELSINTNGVLCGKAFQDTWDRLTNGGQIVVSLDAPVPGDHDGFRQGRSFDSITANVRAMLQRGLDVTLKCCISRLNANSLRADFEFGPGEFSIEAWIWIDPEGTLPLVIMSKWNGASKSWMLMVNADGRLKGRVYSTGRGEASVVSNDMIPTGAWVHVAFERDSAGELALYVDGVKQDDTESFTASLDDTAEAVVIGGSGAGDNFTGKIDEARLSSAARGSQLGKVVVDYVYNARNQLVTETCGANVRTYEYDQNGNTTKITETVAALEIGIEDMTYDELDRMTSYSGPKGSGSSTYRGAAWHRFSQSSRGISKSFLYDGDNVLADISGGDVAAFYVTPFLDQNLSMTRDSATHYYSQDGLGSVRTLTDSSGNIENRYDYSPFGKPFAPGTSVCAQQRYTYTGREWLMDSGLMYHRYRQYDPRAGRFLQRDPLSEAQVVLHSASGIVAGQWTEAPFGLAFLQYRIVMVNRPLGVNSYVYADDRPAATCDPSGLYTINKRCCCRIDAWVGSNRRMTQRHVEAINRGFPGHLQAMEFLRATGGRTSAYLGSGALNRKNKPKCIVEAQDDAESLIYAPGRIGMIFVAGPAAAAGAWITWVVTLGHYGGYTEGAIASTNAYLLSEWGVHVMEGAKFQDIRESCVKKFGPTSAQFQAWLKKCCK